MATTKEMEALGTGELRKLARAEFSAKGIPTSWTAMGTREELISALTSYIIPQRFQNDGSSRAVTTAEDAGKIEKPADFSALKKSVGIVLKNMNELIDANKKELSTEFDGKSVALAAKVLELHSSTREALDRFQDRLDMIAVSSLTVEIIMPDMPKIDAGRQHRAFPELIKTLSLGIPAYLCGPAGSGKTEGAYQVAKALSLPFWPQSVCQQTSKADMLGYINPGTGLLVRTPFREAYENGGVYLIDEIDAGNPNVTLILNSALSNGGCSFPDGYIEKHKDFRCIAAANTWGSGADRMYVGRNQIDAATLSRFGFIAWDYDEDFEVYLCGDASWAKRVQAIRKQVMALRERIVVSPRASIYGAKWIKAGGNSTEAEMKFIFGGVADDTRKKILSGVGR